MKTILTILLLFIGSIACIAQNGTYTSLEAALKEPEKVIHLNLANQGLTSIPKGLKDMVNIQTMDLSGNKIANLPSFAPFEKLESLNLSGNPLSGVPSFVRLAGKQGNVICENCEFTKVEVATGKNQKIDHKGFEGTIRIPDGATIEAGKSTSGQDILKILPEGSGSKQWLEIVKKGESSNDDVINNIVADQYIRFDYFLNKHITYDKTMDTLPAFVMYCYTDNTKKVGIVSRKAIVFYDEYYITIQSNERSILLSQVKNLLKTALTYSPESGGNNINFSKLQLKAKSAGDLIAMSRLPEITSMSKSLPELTPTKETIYTLAAGETVAYTNEYQMGLSLNDIGYYIYLKKAGKYYVKTAKKMFGPYDAIPSAEPNAGFLSHFTQEFQAVKNKQTYFISDGVEYGPYPEGAVLSVMEDGSGNKRRVVKYGSKEENYVEIDGKKYGPFNNFVMIDFWKEKAVFNGYAYGEASTIYIDGEPKFKDLKLTYYYVIDNGHLQFGYKKDNQYYVQFDDQTLGPFEDIKRKSVVDDKLRIWYISGGKHYLSIDGKVMGPYDEIKDHFSGQIHTDFIYKKDGKYFSTIDGNTYGPFEKSPTQAIDATGKVYYLVYEKNGMEYFVFKGKHYGPFKKVLDLSNFRYQVDVDEDKQPMAMTKNADGTFSVFTRQKNYLSLKTKPIVMYSDSLDKTAIVYKELNSAGETDFYLLLEDARYGPFKEIKTEYYEAEYSAGFCKYTATITTKDGKFMRIDEHGIWGTYNDLKVGYGKHPQDKCKLGDSWYIRYDQKLLGPVSNVPFMEPASGDTYYSGELSLQAGNVVVFNYERESTNQFINNVKMDSPLYIVGENGNNFLMMTYEAGVKGSYLLNGKLVKDKGLLSSTWDENSKAAIWLSLEGKNLVRYKVKL